MTLQELLELGNKFSNGETVLSPIEELALISTLKSYGEEVLKEGQVLKEGRVAIVKSLTGHVLIQIH